MKSLERGEYGYLKQRKTRLWLLFLGTVALGVLIFLSGLAVQDHILKTGEEALRKAAEEGNISKIFTVLAILMVLPAAKTLVLIIVTFPYRCMDSEEKAFIDGVIAENDTVFYDAVFTSKERPMHLDAVIVTGHQVVGYTARKGDNVSKIEEYYKKEFELRHLDFVCFVTDSEKALVNRMKLRNPDEEPSKDRGEVLEFIRTSVV